MAYAELEPFGPQFETWRMGQLCALTANIHRQKGKRAYKPSDFFRLEEMEQGVESPSSMWAKAAMITAAYERKA